MEFKKHLKSIFSLSAASLALLQSTPSAKAKDIQAITGDLTQGAERQQRGSEKIVLTPASADGVTQLLAAHRSHSSHSSHSSHRSHYSSYGSGYSAPSPTVPSAPIRPSGSQSTWQTPIAQPSAAQANDRIQRVINSQKQGAAWGYAGSQYSLGLRYLSGDGLERSDERGKLLMEMADKQNYVLATEKLRELETATSGTIRVSTSAPVTNATSLSSTSATVDTNTLILLEKPAPTQQAPSTRIKEAATGSSEAQYEIGLRYITGDGVEKSLERGRMMLELAELQGHVKAKALLEATKSR